MSKRSKKKKTKGQKARSLIHYFIHKMDREAWGSPTMCGKKGSGTWDHTKATCKECMKHTNWTAEQYHRACDNPLIFCPNCEAGQLLVKDVRPTQYLASCNTCDLLEWRDRAVD
jgi:hypothetical protein